ncbi:MAG: DNA methyltransferase [Actinomycetota bacterium]|nr:DNA methyltransferase [Actinomycetota bacterium]
MTDTTPTPRTPRCTARPEPERSDVPLGIWPVAQQTAQRQRAGRYLPEVARHPGKMLPALARRIVAEYCAPGALVADPMCGIGTTLAEAALLGRRAVGVELEARWALLAEANLDHMLDAPARQQVEVRRGDARHLAEVCADLAARVDLVVTSPPYGCDAGMIDKRAWLSGGRLCPVDTLNYSTDKANLGHARGQAYEQAMAEIYTGCARLLRPGGHLVVVTKNTRRRGAMLDLAGLTVALATAAGFSYLGHVIALHAAIRDGDLVARPSYWQATQVRHARAKGEPAHLVAHEDVSVFLLPGTRKDPADAR